MLFNKAKGVVKKVTLEVIYEVVEERSREIYERLEKLERRQEEDYRHLNSMMNHRMDTMIQMLSEILGSR